MSTYEARTMEIIHKRQRASDVLREVQGQVDQMGQDAMTIEERIAFGILSQMLSEQFEVARIRVQSALERLED